MSNHNSNHFDRRNFLQAVAAVGVASGQSRSETTADVAAQKSTMPTEDATTADILIDHLIEWDVTHVFCHGGTGSTRSSMPCGDGRTGFASSGCAMKKRLRSWHAAGPKHGQVGRCLRQRGLVRFTC